MNKYIFPNFNILLLKEVNITTTLSTNFKYFGEINKENKSLVFKPTRKF